MDTMKQISHLFSKYKYVALAVLAGLALMLIPSGEEPQPVSSVPVSSPEESMGEALELILAKIQGVGKVQVLLTEARGSRTVYVVNESTTSDTTKTDTLILTDENRAQKGLVSQVLPPVYQGAIIVCQGGDDPVVKLSVVEAVCDATGLSADRITVLKMK